MIVCRAFLKKYLPIFCLLLYALAATVGVFIGGLWAPIGIGGAIIIYGTVTAIEGRMPVPNREWLIFTLAVLGVLAILNLTSSQPELAWKKWSNLVVIFLPLMLLSATAIRPYIRHPLFFSALALAIIAGALALSFELCTGAPLLAHFDPGAATTKYNRGFSYLVLLAFPALAALATGRIDANERTRIVLFILFVLFILIPADMTESRAAKLALLVGIGVTGLSALWRLFMQNLLAVVPLLIIGWPFAAQEFFNRHEDWLAHFPASWHARMEIWDYMSYRILEHPWLGWGLDSSHTLPATSPHSWHYVFVTGPVGHPHNVVIQLWVELGLPGLMLGLIFAFLTLCGAARLEKRIVPFAFGAWAAALCLTLVAYDFWTDAGFAAFALTGLCFSLLNGDSNMITTGKIRFRKA